MGCRCNERGEAISRGTKAAATGNLKAVAQEAGFVVKTLAEDTGSAFKRAAITARARLQQRRR